MKKLILILLGAAAAAGAYLFIKNRKTSSPTAATQLPTNNTAPSTNSNVQVGIQHAI